MLLLALDTATPAVTVAVHDGRRVLTGSTRIGATRHGELLAPGIAEALAACGATPRDLTDVAVGTGPGPFTGLRVGLATARTVGAVLGIAVHGVPTHDALALLALRPDLGDVLGGARGDGGRGGSTGPDGSHPQEPGHLPRPGELAELAEPGELDGGFLVVTDARRREVYWSRYGGVDGAGLPVRRAGPAVDRPADVDPRGLPVVGRGAALHPGDIGPARGPLDPAGAAVAAYAVARLAAGAPLEAPVPRYLRRPDAVAPAARKRVLR